MLSAKIRLGHPGVFRKLHWKCCFFCQKHLLMGSLVIVDDHSLGSLQKNVTFWNTVFFFVMVIRKNWFRTYSPSFLKPLLFCSTLQFKVKLTTHVLSCVKVVAEGMYCTHKLNTLLLRCHFCISAFHWSSVKGSLLYTKSQSALIDPKIEVKALGGPCNPKSGR